MSWNANVNNWSTWFMGNKLISPFAVEQAQMSTQIYSINEPDQLTSWQCSVRVPHDIALSIYQRNLHTGVAQHLQAHFPVAHAYIGSHAYRAICAEYLKASPPAQPIFTLYAAHFPGFVLEYGELHQEQLIWIVAARLMQIDFFHHNAFCENQCIDVENRDYQLWLTIKSIIGSDVPIQTDGLYQRVELHPERHQQQKIQQITLLTFWENGELYFRVA